MDDLFFADPIPLESLTSLEKNSPNVIIWAAPVMFFFVAIEYIIARRQNKEFYADKKETFGSILIGIGNVAIGTLIKTGLLFLVVLAYNMVPWRMSLNWWTFIPCYIIFDFFSYCAHHVSHKVRFFWATHVTHHSGEHYNLTVSFRLSWVQYLKIIFFMPVAFMGFHPVIIFVTNQIAVLFQFWVHTEYIRRLHPIIEYIFATPSNHRVHHGTQEKYINKNYGATFIFWDRIFNTFQKEEEQSIYGLTHNVDHKGDPIYLNFHEYYDMIRDVKSTKSWKEKFFYVFGDPEKIARHKYNKMILEKEKNSDTEEEEVQERIAV